jgi:type II secretory pathway component PulF
MDIVALFILILLLFAILGYKKPGIAMLTMPIVCLLLIYSAAWYDLFEYIAFAPILFVTTLAAVLLAKRETDYEQWPQILAKWLLRGFAFVLFLLIVVIAIDIGGAAAFLSVGFSIAGLIILIGLIISYGVTSRHMIATYVISTIGSSMRQNLPLPMALESAVSGRTDKRSQILRKIMKWLVQGYSLSESIKRGYPKCPGYVVAMIAAAEQINQLPNAIASIEADMLAKADEKRKLKPVHPFYPVILVTFLFLIIWTYMWKVLPTFITVLSEMTKGKALPPATQILLHITIYWRLIGLVFALIIFVIVPVSIYTNLRPRRPYKPYLLSRIGDFIKWHLPILYWFERNYSMVQTVELLRLSLNAGCTVNDAIANTLGLDVNNCFKKRLQKWLKKIEAGDNIATAAKESDLGSTLAWAFDQKINQGNTLTILEALESFYRTNYNYYINLARFIMWPCVTIMMGAMVGFVVYAIFSPGVAIIRNLAETIYP